MASGFQARQSALSLFSVYGKFAYSPSPIAMFSSFGSPSKLDFCRFRGGHAAWQSWSSIQALIFGGSFSNPWRYQGC
jgi:hypothetical protein